MAQEKKFFSPIFRTYNDNLNKRWRIEWYVPIAGGKSKRCSNPIYISGNTIEERYKNAENKVKGLRFDLPKIKSKTVFDKVFEYKFTWKPKTVSSYRTVIDSFDKWRKSKPTEYITEKDFPNYLIWLKMNGYSINNIAKFRDVVYTFYEYAIRLKLTKNNPVIKETRIRKQPKSLLFFTDKQIELFRNADINKQLWLSIRFLYYCFIRPGEQRNMKIEWINFEHRFIEIPSEHSKNGKTQKVMIPDNFYSQIEWLQDYPNNYYVLSKSEKPGLEQISTKWLNDKHHKVLDDLKIRGRYAFYSWKHTGAVKAVKAGINLKDLQMQLRHHSLDMVNEYLKNLGVMDSEDLKNKFPTL